MPLVVVFAGHETQLLHPDELYRPIGHAPLQLDDDSPVTLPYSPAAHELHANAFATALYVPAGHNIGDDDVQPIGHAYPGDDTHVSEHVEMSTAPTAVPAVPAGQAVHVLAPPPPKRPAGHGTPEELVEPRGQ